MEFLLVWVLSGNLLDTGMRYQDAASCVADAKNSGIELKGVGFALPQFTCLPVADGKEIKLLAPSTPKSAFPF